MDPRLKKALEFSEYHHTLSLQSQILKEKTIKRLLIGYNGGLFDVNRDLISFSKTLIDMGRTTDVPFLDKNDKPVLVNDMNDFLETLISTYFSALNEYYFSYDKILKQRSVEGIISE